MEESPRVSGLNVFPIKSCQPQPVQEVAIDAWGVAGDRRLMVVDGTGRFVSQRRFSQLATVSVQDEGAGQLRVSAPDAERDLCLVPRQDGPRSECSVWESRVGVVDQGEEAGHWFSELLGTGPSSLRLVASAEHSPGFLRQVGNLPPALRARLPPAPLALADAGPISLISAESLADLNGRLRERCGHEVGLDRFRMNVEVSGCGQPFQEDEWLLVRIGTVPFLAYASAERCKMTGIDQRTGEVDNLGPLEVLRGYRAPRGPGHALFGQLLLPLGLGGRIRLGDTVQVLERKK